MLLELVLLPWVNGLDRSGCIREGAVRGGTGLHWPLRRRGGFGLMRMKQVTLAAAADQGEEFERFCRPTRRDVFLQMTDAIVPWVDLCELIERRYLKAGKGRPPSAWSAGCACRPCSTDSTLPTRFVRKRCWTAPRHAASWASTGAASVFPTAAPCLSSAACSRTTSTGWASHCSPRSVKCCRARA